MFQLKKTSQSFVNQAILLLNPSPSFPLPENQALYLRQKIENLEQDYTGMILTEQGLVFVAIVRKKDLNPSEWLEKLRQAGAKICDLLNAEKIKHLSLQSYENQEDTLAFMEGIYLKNYQFLVYKKDSEKIKNSLETIFLETPVFNQQDIDRLETVCSATFDARDLANFPPYYLNAPKFVEIAKKMVESTGIEVEVFDESRIVEEKMVGLINVNRGSEVPPHFLKMEYKPQNPINEKPIVLIGKGILFDTGGYSLKPSDKMQHMKADMAGGAMMVGAISAIAKLNLPYHVITLVPLCENRVNSQAYTVDEILQYPNGLSVEIQNTDAEGRLILADALIYAQKLNPWFVIDSATLTGASYAITAEYGITFNSKNFPYTAQLVEAGYLTQERLIELPLWREFDDMLKSNVADIRNVGGPLAGATTAAKFLERFTAYPWVHLDIAGMSWIESGNGYLQPGGSGVGVRLIVKFLELISK